MRQLDAVAARFTPGLAAHAQIIATGATLTYLDIDDTVRSTFGYPKQGAGYGYSGVKGLNALLATVSSASSAPVIVATRLRKASTNSARGAARLVADAIKTSRSSTHRSRDSALRFYVRIKRFDVVGNEHATNAA